MTGLGIEILYVGKSILVIGICQKSLTSEVKHVGKVLLRSWNMWEKSDFGLEMSEKSD
jgi:hypothetical protein